MNTVIGRSVKVDWLKQEEIEGSAQQLLHGYQNMNGILLEPPVPIENIIQRFLKLKLEIDDLRGELGHLDVIGAIYFDEQRIAIDSTLEDEDGRFNFTCAHEAMHWILHRRYFINNPNQLVLFGNDDDRPSSFVCRGSQSREPHEWQADYGAACLLMPRHLLIGTVKNRFAQEQLVFRDSKSPDSFDDYTRRIASSLNRDFAVSISSMAIRLQQLHILRDGRSDIFN